MVDLDLEPGAMQIFERCCERYGDKYASGMFDDGLNGWILDVEHAMEEEMRKKLIETKRLTTLLQSAITVV